jgi:dTDP-4-dehydrorhamnose 3,5-epimerase
MSDTNFISKTSLHGVYIINRPTYADDRGFFRESIRVKDLESETGTKFSILQANHARSSKNILRGIHVAPWNKLIYVTRGKVQAVIVDVQKDSPTFGKHESFILGDETKTSLYVPKGCGNSYLVLSEEADYTYLTDQEWAPGLEYNIAWDDADLAIKWEFEGEPVLSEKDKGNPPMREVFPDRFK